MRDLSLYGEKYREAIIGKMNADHARNVSDEEIERTLALCVCGDWLVPCAKYLRDNGQLALSDLTLSEQEPFTPSEDCDFFKLLDSISALPPSAVCAIAIRGTDDAQPVARLRLRQILDADPSLVVMVPEECGIDLSRWRRAA